jgi:class 3 adenylate cyclase
VLFTDLVGSTELLAGLATAAADEFVNHHFAALRDALSVHRGHARRGPPDRDAGRTERRRDGARPR